MTPAVHTVDGVERTRLGRGEAWAVATTGPDGVRILYVIPADALAWRAAEYGIDPADSRTLLDIALHERLLTQAEHDHQAPDFVYNTDAATARAAHLARIAALKERTAFADPDGLLEAVHRAHTVDPEFIKAAAGHVARTRLAAADRSRRG